ncbi:unnamed protein product [Calypogeia fissa]
MAKRPRSEVQFVLIHVKGDNEDAWVPKRIEIDSWITLRAPKRGPWAKHGNFIAQVKKFKFSPNSTVLTSVLVSHAFYQRQLQVESTSRHRVPASRTNYIYPSNCQDLQEPTSILDVVLVLHVTFGEATRGSRSHKGLLDSGVFFYDAHYMPPVRTGKVGKVMSITFSRLKDPTFPVPDMTTSEAYRARLFSDFHMGMKASTGGRVCRLSWFLPIHVMADLFSVQSSVGMHQTKTLFVFKPASEELLASLMDSGWDVKIEAANDIIKCRVVKSSIAFRYHTAQQMLYTTFGYVHERLQNNVWVAMDQCGDAEMMSLKANLLDETSVTLDVGKKWGFRDLREEVGFYMDANEHISWVFGIMNATKAGRWEKINKRQEKDMSLEDIGDNNLLRIKVI